MGYAKEYFVERYFREAMIARIAPVSRELILNYIAERAFCTCRRAIREGAQTAPVCVLRGASRQPQDEEKVGWPK